VTDLDLARLAAAAYDPAPVGTIVDWHDVRAVIVGKVCAVRGTKPDNFQNWLRDLAVHNIPYANHPRLGRCPAGALEAAEALAALIPASVTVFTGHSLGGQIAEPLAGIRADAGGAPGMLVTWDAPKGGDAALSRLLGAWECRQYRFLGSPITRWPFGLDQHVREPLIDIGDWTADVIEAHSITRAVAWLAAREAVAA
jgi:hypothetical protein